MWKIIFYLSCAMHYSLSWEVSKLETPEIETALAPIWDDQTQSLYFMTLKSKGNGPNIFRYSFQDKRFFSACIEGVKSPTFIIPIKNSNQYHCDQQCFAVGSGNQVLRIDWNGKSTKAKIVESIFEIDIDSSSHWTVGSPDGKGRFYGGTVSEKLCNSSPSSSLYRYDKKRGVDRLFDGITSTTAVVFNEKEQKMYHLDTCRLVLTGYDWNSKTGDICNGRLIHNFPKHDQFSSPHGLDVDTFGMLYTALYNGEVWKINPWKGNVVDVYKLPVRGASGVALGGPKRDILFVTTQTSVIDSHSSEVVEKIVNGSSVYLITGLNVAGLPYSRRLDI